MTLRAVAALTVAVVVAACASGPAPSSGPSFTSSPQASPTGGWPPFQPGSVMETVVQALDLSCESVVQRIHCQSIRPSGARLEAVAPDGTVAADRELSFSASGPILLESEARRLFAAVANAATGDPELSRAWQDQIWTAFDDPQVSTAVLPNGANWTASRQEVGDVLIWSLNISWETSTEPTP